MLARALKTTGYFIFLNIWRNSARVLINLNERDRQAFRFKLPSNRYLAKFSAVVLNGKMVSEKPFTLYSVQKENPPQSKTYDQGESRSARTFAFKNTKVHNHIFFCTRLTKLLLKCRQSHASDDHAGSHTCRSSW